MTAAHTPTSPSAAQPTRRELIKQGAASAALFASLSHLPVFAAGSDAPEKKEVKIGFIPLTDWASTRSTA